MKKQNMPGNPRTELDADEMLPEYRFDYRQRRPNRFAAEVPEGSLLVLLEPDIARVFKTEEAVRGILRAIAEAMPEAQKP